jgi:multiple sugar transport system substrate-binding protein
MYATRKFFPLTVLMTSLIVLGLLAGCAAVPQPPAPPPVEEEPAAAAPAEEAPAAGEAEMVIKGVFHPNDESDGDIVEATGMQSVLYREMFPAFRERNPGVELVAEDLLGDTEGRTKYLLQCREGTQADMIELDGFWIAEFAALGCTRPLDDLLPQELLDDYFDAFKVTYQGKVHALVDGTAFNSMLWYREDLLEEAGLEGPPQDWNELIEYAEKLTVKDDAGNVIRYGLTMPAARSEHTSVVLLSFYWQGEDMFVTDDNMPAFNNQTSIDAFETFAEIYQNGGMMPEVINMLYTDVQNAFFADKAAMMLHGSWMSAGMYNMAPDLEGKVGLAPNPVYPVTGNRGANAGGWSYAVTTPDDEKVAAAADLVYVIAGGLKDAYIQNILESGDIPVLKSLADDPIFVEETFAAEPEWQEIILSELPYAKTRPAVEIYPDASLEWSQAFQETLLGDKTAEEALVDAEERTLTIAREKGYLME